MPETMLFVLLLNSLLLSSDGADQPVSPLTYHMSKEIAKIEKGNFLWSPTSVEVLLGLVQSGAKGATGQEIRALLGVPDDAQDQVEAHAKTVNAIFVRRRKASLRSANKLYVSAKVQLKDTFTRTAREVYGSVSEKVDFGKSEAAAATINKWVGDATANKIKNLIDPKSLNSDTTAVLVNAIYLKGDWYKQFDSIGKADFFADGKKAVKVDTMKVDVQAKYYDLREADATVVQLDLAADDVKFVIVIPNEKNGLDKIEEKYNNTLSHPLFKSGYVQLTLPKFKIQTEVNFKDLLTQVGAGTMFSADADLSGIAGDKGQIRVTHIVQKAFIEVNEVGLEAAAASGAVIDVLNARPKPERKFYADRPFLFSITIGDLVVFTGRVVDPSV